MADAAFIRLAAGPEVDLGIELAPTGARAKTEGERSIPTAIGAVGQAGVLFRFGRLSIDLAFRFTLMQYDLDGVTNASHPGFVFGLHYVLM